MDKVEKMYVATVPFHRISHFRKKKATLAKEQRELPRNALLAALERIFRVREILGIYEGIREERYFFRNALIYFRLRTWGLIGGIICGTCVGFYSYLSGGFSLISIILSALSGGAAIAYLAARLTLLSSESTVNSGNDFDSSARDIRM
jgi:hypothetical protein